MLYEVAFNKSTPGSHLDRSEEVAEVLLELAGGL